MSEHLIRFRAAWEGVFVDTGVPRVERVDLPRSWAAACPKNAFSLRRKFQAPRLEPGAEELLLRLEGTYGLRRVTLNGLDCRPTVVNEAVVELEIADLRATSNELMLDVDPSDWPPSVRSGEQLWGMIALVIRPRAALRPDGGGHNDRL